MELFNLYWNGKTNISVAAILISISRHRKFMIYIKIGDRRKKATVTPCMIYTFASREEYPLHEEYTPDSFLIVSNIELIVEKNGKIVAELVTVNMAQ